ncbi:hypothetical protein ASD11_03935 [Aeromicrobium sp. Root495]|nr:hypothetical protein ASD11_03935 [Aeromicrobium sp. Root495]
MVRSIVVVEPDPDELPGAHLIDTISACEQVIRAAEAIQAQHAGMLLAEREPLMEGRHAFLSAAGETALARGMSPSAGITQLETAITLSRLPAVQAAWVDGLVSGVTVRAIVKNLPSLDHASMALFEAELEPHLPGLTPRAAAELTRSLTLEIDPDEADRKALAAREDQYVFVADEADGVATLIAHGPAELIHQIADPLLASARRAKNDPGDQRSRGQVMFQTLHASAVAGPNPELETMRTLELAVVISAEHLLGAGDTPAELVGHGPVAPVVLDQLIDEADRVFYRRLVTDPVDGRLLHTDPRRRLFTGALARHVRYRDKRCQGPSCDAAIAEIDHVREFQHGGPTTAENAEGLCVTTHTMKSIPGWAVSHDGATWTTPTGHTYPSPPPPDVVRRRRE